MKELCEPSVNRNQFKFFRQCSFRWTPQSVSRVDVLADIYWTPHSHCLQMISWLTYVRCPPTQKIISVRIFVDLCWTPPPNTCTHKEKQHNKCYCTCSYDVSRIAATYMLEIPYTDMFFFCSEHFILNEYFYIYKRLI